MEFLAIKWMWLYLGCLLMLLELTIPGFVIFFFGLAAAAVSGILFLFDISFALQLALFSIFSVLFIVLLRKWFTRLFLGVSSETKDVESEFVGRVAVVTEKISLGESGRILLRDSQWDAVAAEEIDAGAKVRVISQKNLTLTVEKI